MRFRIAVLLILAATPLSGCRQPVAIVFPNERAELDNPVHLVASEPVTWFDGGEKLGVGASWSGFLSEGKHDIRALALSGEARLRLLVRPLFPIGEITAVPAGFEVPKPPAGEFVRVWGQTNEKPPRPVVGALSSSPVTPSPRYGLLTAYGPDAEEAPPFGSAVSERLFSRAAALLRDGRSSACGAGCVRRPSRAVPLDDAPAQRTFKVLNLRGYGYDEVAAHLVFSGERTLAYLETGQTEEVRDGVVVLAEAFDSRIQKRVQTAFGRYSDVDGNGKVILLFTPRLNASGLAIGFFYPGDLFPTTDDLPESNEAEILYLGVPEEGSFNFSADSLSATACHELQHLVNFSHVTLPYAGDPNPPLSPIWLNEGLSHLAEDLCGYNTLGGNLAFVARFLQRPWEISLTSTSIDGTGDSVERRGAAYLFLRYAMEQAGGVQLDAGGGLTGGGLSFTRALMSPDALTLNAIAEKSIGVRDGARLLWRWWWTMVTAGLEHGGMDVASRYPWAVYAPPVYDAQTGDELGVDLFRGEITLADYTFSLNGLRYAEDCSTADVPARAVCVERTNRPVPGTASWADPDLQVMRVR